MALKSIRTLFLVLFLCGFSPAYFAQQMAVELKDLSLGADIIITGKVTKQISSWNDDNTRIYTRATIQVEEYLKGNNNGAPVVVRYLGGEVGDIGEQYSHMPRFEDKEEVLVFLKRDNKNADFKVISGEEGKINIVNDPKTGEKVTTSNVRVSDLKAQIKTYVNQH
jgi:hypothetical protein